MREECMLLMGMEHNRSLVIILDGDGDYNSKITPHTF